MATISLPSINYADPHLYEHLTLIIDEFEKTALRSGSRQGILVTAQAPLAAMDQILKSSDKALTMGRTANASRASSRSRSSSGVPDGGEKAPAGTGTSAGDSAANTNTEATETEPWIQSHNNLRHIESGTSEDFIEVEGELGNKTIDINTPSFEVGLGGVEGNVGFDADFNELLNSDSGGAQLGDWLADCLGCDLRISFDWQLQPVDLLLPLAGLLSDINAALDKFEGFLNPNGLLKDLCELLNGLRFLCIPDLIAILMALKMLLKSYLSFQLSIKVDWTLLLGPLLKLILDAIATLLQQIAGIIVAPLDCAYAALMTVSNLQDALAETAAMAGAVGARVADQIVETVSGGNSINENSADWRYKDVTSTTEFVKGNQEEGGKLPDVTLPSISTSNRLGSEEQSADSDFTFLTGFEITSETKLPDALKVPEFLQSNPFKKLALSVKEARDYVMSLVRRIITALRSLEGLVSGSLSMNLGNLGLILFIRDMIRLVMIIIQLFKDYGGNVTDWCEQLRNNPEIAERYIPGTKARVEKDKIVLVKGPEVVAEINTCSTGRTDAQAALMKKWILDLKRSGSS